MLHPHCQTLLTSTTLTRNCHGMGCTPHSALLGETLPLLQKTSDHLQEELLSSLCSMEYSIIQPTTKLSKLPVFLKSDTTLYLHGTVLLQALTISHPACCNNVSATNYALLKFFVHNDIYCDATLKAKMNAPLQGVPKLPSPIPLF